MNLNGATVLITGGSAGIGRAVAASLADAGARVAITGRNEQKLAEAAASLGVHPIRADVTSEDDVLSTYEEVMRTFGHLDVLVNNAGFGTFTELVDTDRHSFEAVFATNVTGAMLMAREPRSTSSHVAEATSSTSVRLRACGVRLAARRTTAASSPCAG